MIRIERNKLEEKYSLYQYVDDREEVKYYLRNLGVLSLLPAGGVYLAVSHAVGNPFLSAALAFFTEGIGVALGYGFHLYSKLNRQKTENYCRLIGS